MTHKPEKTNESMRQFLLSALLLILISGSSVAQTTTTLKQEILNILSDKADLFEVEFKSL